MLQSSSHPYRDFQRTNRFAGVACLVCLVAAPGCVNAVISHQALPGTRLQIHASATEHSHQPTVLLGQSPVVLDAQPADFLPPGRATLSANLAISLATCEATVSPRFQNSHAPPWTIQLASYQPTDPAWLTGEIEVGPTPPAASIDDFFRLTRSRSPSLEVARDIGYESNSETPSGFTPLGFDQPSEIPLTLPPRPTVTELSVFDRIGCDHRQFYSPDSLAGLAYGLAGGALMANTNFDNTVRNHFQSSVRNASTDEWAHFLGAQKKLGNGYYTIPAFAVAWAAGSMLEGNPAADNVGEWGERSFRSILVGAPPMLATQYLIGGSRPTDPGGSHWSPFQDNNGVSGHSFMGAVPFLTAAQMAGEPWLKVAFYAGSTLVPLSRINDDAHYTSQAFLGWWFAFLAARAIDSTQSNESDWTFAPWLEPGTSGFAAEYRF